MPQCHFPFHSDPALGHSEGNYMSNLMKDWIIVTGVTRGIGKSLATEFQKRGYSICGVVRPSVGEAAKEWLDEVVTHDLSEPFDKKMLLRLSEVLSTRRVIGVVHAAGLLGPMTTQPRADEFELWNQWWAYYQQTFQVNLHSGIQLMSACWKELHEWSGPTGRRSPFVLHLSSGAAVKPYPGWGTYCASKAALLMEFKCWAAKTAADICNVLSVAPGTVMTDMMQQVLSANPSDFPALAKFKDLEKNGGLVEPELPAKLICDWLLNLNHEQISKWHGELYDVRSSSSATK